MCECGGLSKSEVAVMIEHAINQHKESIKHMPRNEVMDVFLAVATHADQNSVSIKSFDERLSILENKVSK